MLGPVLGRPRVIATIISNGYADVALRSPRVTSCCLPATVVDKQCSIRCGDTGGSVALHPPTRDGAEQAETALNLLLPWRDQDDLQLDAEPRQVTVLCGYLANTTVLAETPGPHGHAQPAPPAF